MAARLLTASLLTFIFASSLASVQFAWAQTATKSKALIATKPPTPTIGTVGIITGDIDSTGIKIASDLARTLDDGNNLRIVPVIGRGSYQNINDLLTLKSIDIAIVQSDVLARFQKTTKDATIPSRVNYISKLYSEEFHILSRMQFLCLQDLNGRRVSFGPKDSGMAITAEAVFEAHNISVDPLYLHHEEAIEKLKRGDIDALVYVGGKPSRAFDRVTYKDHVHFLDVDYLSPLRNAYLPAIMTSEDYPNLIAPNESIATIGVSSIMAVHNWNPQTERFRVMSRFVDKFFNDLDKLKGGTYDTKWREVNLRAPVKNLTRFQPAEKWLASHIPAKTSAIAPQAAQQLKTMLQKFVESQKGSSTDKEELFNQFVHWYQNQSAQQ